MCSEKDKSLSQERCLWTWLAVIVPNASVSKRAEGRDTGCDENRKATVRDEPVFSDAPRTLLDCSSQIRRSGRFFFFLFFPPREDLFFKNRLLQFCSPFFCAVLVNFSCRVKCWDSRECLSQRREVGVRITASSHIWIAVWLSTAFYLLWEPVSGPYRWRFRVSEEKDPSNN
jgi:hypothetical protein